MLQRRCKHPTCNELIPAHESHCKLHKTTREQQYNAFRREHDSEYVKFYNSSAWRKLREQILLRNHYICKHCGGLAEMVDHIIPTKQDWNRRLDPTNLQPLCNACHNTKTAKEVRTQSLF